MKAPEIVDALKYTGAPQESYKFEVLHGGLSEWFEKTFDHVKEEKKELKQAFLMHLEWLWLTKQGVKSQTDIDVTVEYDGQDVPLQVMSIYERFFKVDNGSLPKKFGVISL